MAHQYVLKEFQAKISHGKWKEFEYLFTETKIFILYFLYHGTTWSYSKYKLEMHFYNFKKFHRFKNKVSFSIFDLFIFILKLKTLCLH